MFFRHPVVDCACLIRSIALLPQLPVCVATHSPPFPEQPNLDLCYGGNDNADLLCKTNENYEANSSAAIMQPYLEVWQCLTSVI